MRFSTSGALKARAPGLLWPTPASTSALHHLLLPPSHSQAWTHGHTRIYMLAYMYTRAHLGTHAYIHAHTATHRHHMHTYTQEHMCTHLHTHACTHRHTCACTHSPHVHKAQCTTCMHTWAHIYTRTHTGTNALRCTHAHTEFTAHLIQEQTLPIFSFELSSQYGNDPLLSLNSQARWIFQQRMAGEEGVCRGSQHCSTLRRCWGLGRDTPVVPISQPS